MKIQAMLIKYSLHQYLLQQKERMIYVVVSAVVCSVLLPLVLPRRHWLRYYACYASYVTTVSALCPLYIPVFLVRPRNIRNILWCEPAAKQITKLLGIEWQIRNGDKLQLEKNAIVVANHQSILDALGAIHIWHFLIDCTVVAKKEVFYFWPFGLAAWLGGITFIDRTNTRSAYSTLRTVAKRQFNGVNRSSKILMFPEGTRNRTGGSLLPFKKGAFRLAVELQVPIVPVIYSPYYFIQNKKFFDPGKMVISVLDPIPTYGLTFQDVDQLANKIRKLMEAEYQKLRREMTTNE